MALYSEEDVYDLRVKTHQISGRKSQSHVILKITLAYHKISANCVTHAAAAAKSLQSCLTLCDPIDGSPPGSAIPGILQAGTLEWVAISFSNAQKGKVKVKLLSLIQLSVTPRTAAYQAPPSMGFSRQEYWSGWGATAFSVPHAYIQTQ